MWEKCSIISLMFLSKNDSSQLTRNHQINSTFMQDSQQRIWPAVSKTAIVIKVKERPRNMSRLKETRETWQLSNGHCWDKQPSSRGVWNQVVGTLLLLPRFGRLHCNYVQEHHCLTETHWSTQGRWAINSQMTWKGPCKLSVIQKLYFF